MSPLTEPRSFTTRGIVALVFSCVAGILGVCVVAWYGLAKPVEEVPPAVSRILGETSDPDVAESHVPGRTSGNAAASGSGHVSQTVAS